MATEESQLKIHRRDKRLPSLSVKRTHRHCRRIQGDGYQREDGLWDIEATLTDTKSYTLNNSHRGGINPGEALHEMTVIMTVDSDFLIHEIRAWTFNAPFNQCPAAADQYDVLKGLRIASGWMGQVRERLSAVDACTHITELLQYMATVAFQTIFPLISDRQEANENPRPLLLDRCHGYRADGAAVKEQWPEFYTGDD